jgi:TrpR-related protein YerC/YecD
MKARVRLAPDAAHPIARRVGFAAALTNVITRYYISAMKRRAIQPDSAPLDPLDALCDAVLALHERSELRDLLLDLCTPAELEALSDRWRVVPLLLEGLPYREIHDRTAVSVTTIGRVARCLARGAGGYRVAAERLGLAHDGPPSAH